VIVRQNGTIATSGDGAAGVFAQSVGGGGGAGGDASATKLTLNVTKGDGTGRGGYGGQVAVNAGAAITTSGRNAPGILAQSIGGGGGIGSGGVTLTGAPGAGGPVSVNVNAKIAATGPDSTAVFAQSAGGSGGSAVTVSVAPGAAVQGGTGGGAGIILSAGAPGNAISNAGSIGALSGTAILADANTAVTNTGTVTGNVSLGANGSFTNAPGGVFQTGSNLTIPMLQNNASLVLGSGRYSSVSLAGSFVQGATGATAFDVDFTGKRSTLLMVSGTASLAGTITPQLAYPQPNVPLTLVLAGGGLTSSAVATPGFIYNYTVTPQNNALRITVGADFEPAGETLKRNQLEVARALQSSWASGGTGEQVTFDRLAKVTDPAQYKSVLDHLSHEGGLAHAAGRTNTSEKFASTMNSCPEFADNSLITQEGDCAWSRVLGGRTAQFRDADSTGYGVNSLTYEIGGQAALAPGWILGGSIAYETSWYSANGGDASGGGHGFMAGAILKREMGPWTVAGSVFGGMGWNTNNRFLALPAATDGNDGGNIATGSNTDMSVGGRLRPSYQIPLGPAYLKPYVDLDVIHAAASGYSEVGGGSLDLNVKASQRTVVAGSPMLEMGGKFGLEGGLTLRPYVALGATFTSSAHWASQSSLVSAPAGTGVSTVLVPTPSALGNLQLGIDLLNTRGFELKAQYDVQAGKEFLDQTGMLRLSYHF
jgi:uncharacterized protein with beta-barrel porin domain